MKVWLKAGVIIFYVLGYCFLRKRMRRDIVKLFKAYMLVSARLEGLRSAITCLLDMVPSFCPVQVSGIIV